MAPRRPEIDPLGVLRFLLGNKPNWAVCEDMADAEREVVIVGDMADAPETDEYAESFPVHGGLSSPFSGLTDSLCGVSHLSSEIGRAHV